MSRRIKVKRISQGGTPSPNTGKYVVYVALTVVILLVGFGLGRATSSAPENQVAIPVDRTPIGEAFSAYGPTDVKGIVPVGFKKEVQGAVTAATAYVGLTPRLYYADNDIFTVSVHQLTVPDFTQEFINGISEGRGIAQRWFSSDPGTFMRELPIGYTIIEATTDEVKVGIWSVFMVASRPNIAGTTESKYHTIDLKWDGDWKVSGWVTDPGPTPNWEAPPESILTVNEFLESIVPFQGGYDFVPSF